MLSEPAENADLSLWLIYYKQQIEKNHKRKTRLKARTAERSESAITTSFVFTSSTFAPDPVWKPFVMKIIETTSNQYEKKNYKKWKRYCKQMKNQFTQNNVNHMIQFPNLIKIAYADTYLKSNSNANKFWDAKIDFHPNKQYIWIEFKIFLKSDIERAITLQQNLLKKYRKHKQSHNQSIKNYNVERINMFVELKFEFKFTKTMKFNDFRDELRLKFRCMLFKKKKFSQRRSCLNDSNVWKTFKLWKKNSKISKSVKSRPILTILKARTRNSKLRNLKIKKSKILTKSIRITNQSNRKILECIADSLANSRKFRTKITV